MSHGQNWSTSVVSTFKDHPAICACKNFSHHEDACLCGSLQPACLSPPAPPHACVPAALVLADRLRVCAGNLVAGYICDERPVNPGLNHDHPSKTLTPGSNSSLNRRQPVSRRLGTSQNP